MKDGLYYLYKFGIEQSSYLFIELYYYAEDEEMDEQDKSAVYVWEYPNCTFRL